MPNIEETVKKTVKEEVDRVARLSQDAVRSYAYLYPFRVSCCSIFHSSAIKADISQGHPVLPFSQESHQATMAKAPTFTHPWCEHHRLASIADIHLKVSTYSQP